MPTFLIHGFRWPRPLIRVHVILNDLDDAAPDWLMAPGSENAFKNSLTLLHPTIMTHLPDLRFIEQYDPYDEAPASRAQPYAFVADIVHEVNLSVEVDDVRGKGVKNEAWEAMLELRDKLAPGEKVAWFVVYCGDTERAFPSSSVSEADDVTQYAQGQARHGSGQSDATGTSRNGSNSPADEKKKSRLAKLFSYRSNSGLSLRRTKSNKALNGSLNPTQAAPSEPVPSLPNARQTKAYEKLNHASSSHNNGGPASSAVASPQHQPSVKSPNSTMSVPPAPRAGILPSPAASALPSPAFPPHPTTSVPPQPAIGRGTSLDSRASSRPTTATQSIRATQPEQAPVAASENAKPSATSGSKQSVTSSPSKDLPLRQRPVTTGGSR